VPRARGTRGGLVRTVLRAVYFVSLKNLDILYDHTNSRVRCVTHTKLCYDFVVVTKQIELISDMREIVLCVRLVYIVGYL
jgi:hypothetical protein